jgi:hypothetical protein
MIIAMRNPQIESYSIQSSPAAREMPTGHAPRWKNDAARDGQAL